MERPRQEVVYFLATGDGEHIKIGSTRNLHSRMQSLKASSPKQFREHSLLGYIAGGKRRELELHAVFSADRVQGEWFRRSPVIEGFLESAGLSKGSPDGEQKLVTTRLPVSLVKRVKINAANTGRNMTEVFIDALREYLSKPKEEKSQEVTQ